MKKEQKETTIKYLKEELHKWALNRTKHIFPVQILLSITFEDIYRSRWNFGQILCSSPEPFYILLPFPNRGDRIILETYLALKLRLRGFILELVNPRSSCLPSPVSPSGLRQHFFFLAREPAGVTTTPLDKVISLCFSLLLSCSLLELPLFHFFLPSSLPPLLFPLLSSAIHKLWSDFG